MYSVTLKRLTVCNWSVCSVALLSVDWFGGCVAQFARALLLLSNQQCSRMFAQSTSDTVTRLCYLDLFVLASDGWCFDS